MSLTDAPQWPAADLVAARELTPEEAASAAVADAIREQLSATSDRELLEIIYRRLLVLQADVDGFKLLGEQLAEIGSKGFPGMLAGLFKSS